MGNERMTTKNLCSLIAAGADLLDEQAAAALLTVAPGTLGVWRSTGRYNLPFLKVGAHGAIPPCRFARLAGKAHPRNRFDGVRVIRHEPTHSQTTEAAL
jgi:hypothetical protein